MPRPPGRLAAAPMFAPIASALLLDHVARNPTAREPVANLESVSAPEELRFDLFGSEPAELDHDGSAGQGEATAAAPTSEALSTGELTARLLAVKAKAARPPLRFARDQAPQAVEAEAPRPEPATIAAVDDADEEPDDAKGADDTLSIADFYDRVRRALRGAFPDEVWVTGEIRGLRESRGHRYLELCDHGAADGQRGAAQTLEVVCWARDWPPVHAQLAAAGVDLEVGRVVRVRGKVSVWEGGSRLRFTLTALDIEALLGGIAAARRRLLQALEAEGLLRRNALLEVPLVPLRIGVVTSPGSEAHRDFVGQLEASGFAFVVRLEPSLVQGGDAPGQLVGALDRLVAFGPDLVVVVRGGGGRGDLAAFDAEDVARAIATAPFPVWTGIGHTGDRSVADEVANRSLITPTATGEAVVQRVAQYWAETDRRRRLLASLAAARLDASGHRLQASRAQLLAVSHRQLDRRRSELDGAIGRARRGVGTVLLGATAELARNAEAVGRAADRAVGAVENRIERRRDVLAAFDPRRQLERGWSLTRRASGGVIRSVAGLAWGEQIVTRVSDGEITSVVGSSEQEVAGG